MDPKPSTEDKEYPFGSGADVADSIILVLLCIVIVLVLVLK